MQTPFRKLLIVCGLALGVTAMGQNAGADPGDTLRWESLIGIVQPDNEVGNGTGTVAGSGIPWSTLDGHARVDLGKGSIDFRVRGLVLAGGNAIGTTGAVPRVKGTLMCDTDGSASGGKSVLVDTPLVDLGEQGDAEFSGSVGSLPAVCASERDVAFLIRVGSGRWIANGTVLRSYDARSLTSGQPIIHPEENRDAY